MMTPPMPPPARVPPGIGMPHPAAAATAAAASRRGARDVGLRVEAHGVPFRRS